MDGADVSYPAHAIYNEIKGAVTNPQPTSEKASPTDHIRSCTRMFTSIDLKKSQIDEARPLPQATLRSLRETMILEWTYNSNAIEGNTLTLAETRVVLEGITVGGKSIREHLEAINHRDAVVFLEEIVRTGEPLTELAIRNIHRLVLRGIDDVHAGVYRTENVLITGAKHRPPEHFLIKEQMETLLARYSNEWQSLHTVHRAALLHGEFVKVHPFVDGNGRTARLLMNLELMRDGFPAAIITASQRLQYYEALDRAHTTGNFDTFTALVADSVEASLDLWLSLL